MGNGVVDDGRQVGIAAQEARRKSFVDSEHILHNENLAVAAATGTDAVEFMLAGATAVAVGTANFANPTATVDVIDGIIDYCEQYGVKDVNELIGALEC